MSKLGTVDNPLRILVADNWGDSARPFLKQKYPLCKFHVHTPVPSRHPHGHMVAECILDMLPKDAYVELTFHPYLLIQDKNKDSWLKVLKEARDAGKPFHLCNCSFGAHHQDDTLIKIFLESLWRDGTKLREAKECIGDTIVTFAAGNDDRSKRGRPDWDNDIAYPQKPLSRLPNVFVIGSCNAKSIPSLFSGDGEEVFAMYWGEGVPVYHAINYVPTFVDGTSFASPFACGDIGCLMIEGLQITKENYKKYILEKGWIRLGYQRGKQNRKAGYGSMLGEQAKKLPKEKAEFIVNPATPQQVSYHDFQEVNGRQTKPWWKFW